MAKTIILEYPDSTPFERIRDDIDTLVRGSGGNINSPNVLADDETDDGAALIAHLKRQGRAAEAGTGGAEVASNQVLITSGDTVLCGADLIQFTIVGGAVTDYQITGGA